MTRVPYRLSRRRAAASLAALALVPYAFAQPGTLRLRKINCFELCVRDVAASVAFYQRVFGMPVQARAGDRVSLRIGAGPQHLRIRAARTGEAPAITQLGYSVEDFDVVRALATLRGRGFAEIEPPARNATGSELALHTWVSVRGETAELFLADERDLVVQLSAADYCGGGGLAGNECRTESAPARAALAVDDINHLTVFVADGAAANDFYRDLFGLATQAQQGPGTPVLGIGDGRQFVMYASPGGGANVATSIHHGCLSMRDFDVERVLATLTAEGLAPRGDRALGPLMHYVTRRMPDRGGAAGGTPELYFTDPDGILLQLQDVSYCGGGGYLGSECSREEA
jgi:catechol 2,3-dioxygenase-like lactoylglutathione lyase family enzyme